MGKSARRRERRRKAANRAASVPSVRTGITVEVMTVKCASWADSVKARNAARREAAIREEMLAQQATWMSYDQFSAGEASALDNQRADIMECGRPRWEVEGQKAMIREDRLWEADRSASRKREYWMSPNPSAPTGKMHVKPCKPARFSHG